MKGLPIGISTLKTIIDNNMVYVDKTGDIESLAKNPGRYFLSRPRRFGKSLLVDTFKELFEGNEELFRGLAIHEAWDWSKKYPVIKIDFASGTITNRETLDEKIRYLLQENRDALGLSFNVDGDVSTAFEELIKATERKYHAPAAVLVDEYDKPLLDNIENPARAVEMRDGLKNLYSVLKKVDRYLHFVFLTGVSKFSKVSIFSGLNNLTDISLDEQYGTLCGYTQEDLEADFAEHLRGVDRQELRQWYNGYGFLGEPVYNPFDILLFIQKGKIYRNYWFETGTPSFLVRLMQKKRYFLPELEGLEAGEELLSSFEIETMEPVTLLFQSGYLTIKESTFRRGRTIYRIGFPNREVRLALSDYLVTAYTQTGIEKERYAESAYDALLAGDMDKLEAAIGRMFAGIPWRNFTHNDLAEYEGFYASVLYAFFVSVTCRVVPEDITNRGQADMTVFIENKVYVMEIKVISGECPEGNSNSALEQIRARSYSEKYLKEPGKQVFELGMVFSQAERNLVRFDYRER